MTKLTKTHAIRFFSMVAMAAVAAALLGGCAAKPVYSINCGSDKVYVDAGGKTWLADQEKTDKVDWGVIGG